MVASFGVAVTTLNRRRLADHTLDAYRRHTPDDIPILVVDDGSNIPVANADHRNPTPRGVAAAKNQCIRLLMQTGVDRLLLSDDDVYPTADNWWEPFVDSPHPHLIFQPREQRRCRRHGDTWHVYDTVKGRFACPRCIPVVAPLWSDDQYFAVEWGAGVLMSVTRDVVNRVGGLRPEFGRWSAETWEWSHRIANITGQTYPFLSPLHADLHAVDAYSTGHRSAVSPRVRDEHRDRNWRLFQQHKDSTDFVPYTETVAVAIPRRDTLDRVDAHEKCAQWWTGHGYTVLFGDSHPDQPFSCSQARNNAVAACNHCDVIVVADADTIPDSVDQIHHAVSMVMASGEPLVVYPYTEFRHIDAVWATKPGDDYRHAPTQQRYLNSPGGMWVMRLSTFELLGGFDEQFAAGLSPSGSCWGYDDTAFRLAAETLAITQRVPGIAWSFNHATDAHGKPDRSFYAPDNPNLTRYRLYETARGNPTMMQALTHD